MRRIPSEQNRLPFFLLILLTFSCDDTEPRRDTSFSYSDAVGKWVIYESKEENGDISRDRNLHDMNLFGAYNGDVDLQEDLTYVPLIFRTDGGLDPEPAEQGTYEYTEATNQLVFTRAFFDQRFEVVKFNRSEMHLKLNAITYKFKKSQ